MAWEELGKVVEAGSPGELPLIHLTKGELDLWDDLLVVNGGTGYYYHTVNWIKVKGVFLSHANTQDKADVGLPEGQVNQSDAVFRLV